MSDDTIYDHADPAFNEERVDEAFRDGAAAMREMLARFVEQGGDPRTAASIRANWHPGFGGDPGQISGELPISAWGMTQEMRDRARARTIAAIEADGPRFAGATVTGAGIALLAARKAPAA